MTIIRKFKLYADCFPVNGFKRGAIYDVNRKSFCLVPNSFINFIINAEGKTKSEIEAEYIGEDAITLENYWNFLKSNEFGFWIDSGIFCNFTDMPEEWDYPAIITNAILDISNHHYYDLFGVLKELDSLGCKHIQIRSYENIGMEYLNKILHELFESQFISVEFIIKYDEFNNEEETNALVLNNKRIKALVFHSSDRNSIKNLGKVGSMGNLAYTRQVINTVEDFHNNSMSYFNVCLEQFLESKIYHSYYNRKVAVDVLGNIKNCTSHEETFGQVSVNSIQDVVLKAEFQVLWNITKDNTLVCKDCEFKYMCLDTRKPYLHNTGYWYHKKECFYNPFIAKFNDEVDFQSLADLGVILTEEIFEFNQQA